MPLIALVDNQRVFATRDGTRRGTCPGCFTEMIAKTGEVVCWHWAHRPDAETACLTEPETEWHLTWKNRAGDPDRIEHTSADRRRRADVITPYGWAVEFQHSSLDKQEVEARESDWQHGLIWVVDARKAHDEDRLRIWKSNSAPYSQIEWAHAPAWVKAMSVRTFLDIDAGLLMLGRWFPKRPNHPITGYGWHISVDAIVDHVLNGRRPPRNPPFGESLEPDTWSAPRALINCPTCGQSLGKPNQTCSAATHHGKVA